MTQAEKDKIIKELQEKLAEVEKIKVEEPKRWKPEYDETYWMVESNGYVCHLYWNNDRSDDWHYIVGNCFKTKEEAEEYKKQIEYTARYKNYIEEHSEPLDWDNQEQEKYYAVFNNCKREIAYQFNRFMKTQGVIYASSEEIILDAIKEIGEDNFKKYVLGVK